MPRLTEEQLTARRLTIGSSDIAAIAGLDPRKTAMDVWMEKMDLLPDDITEAGDWGHRLEPVVAEAYIDRLRADLELQGQTTAKLTLQVRPNRETQTFGRYSCTPDYFGAAALKGGLSRWIVEIKCRAGWRRIWGEDGSSDVPEEIRAQVQWQLMINPHCERVDVAVLFGTHEMCVYPIPADPVYQAGLVVHANRFLELLDRGMPPEIDGSEGWSLYLKQRFPQAADRTVRQADGDPELEALLAEAGRWRGAKKQAEAALQLANQRLEAEIGTCYGLEGKHGRAIWSNIKEREKVDWEKVARELAGVLSTTDWPSRVDLERGAVLQKFSEPHTTTIPATRRLNFTARGEEDE